MVHTSFHEPRIVSEAQIRPNQVRGFPERKDLIFQRFYSSPQDDHVVHSIQRMLETILCISCRVFNAGMSSTYPIRRIMFWCLCILGFWYANHFVGFVSLYINPVCLPCPT